MILNFILLSLLFAFVYWWFMIEDRLERFCWLFWYLIIAGLNPLLWGFSQITVLLTAMLLVLMIFHWYIGFKTGYGVIDGS